MTDNGGDEDRMMSACLGAGGLSMIHFARDRTTAALLNYDIMCKIAEAQNHGLRRADVLRVLEEIVEDVRSDLDYQTYLEDGELLQTRTR